MDINKLKMSFWSNSFLKNWITVQHSLRRNQRHLLRMTISVLLPALCVATVLGGNKRKHDTCINHKVIHCKSEYVLLCRVRIYPVCWVSVFIKLHYCYSCQEVKAKNNAL